MPSDGVLCSQNNLLHPFIPIENPEIEDSEFCDETRILLLSNTPVSKFLNTMNAVQSASLTSPKILNLFSPLNCPLTIDAFALPPPTLSLYDKAGFSVE